MANFVNGERQIYLIATSEDHRCMIYQKETQTAKMFSTGKNPTTYSKDQMLNYLRNAEIMQSTCRPENWVEKYCGHYF